MMKQIGRYQIRNETGRGGMSTVYEAFDPQFKRLVAVKVMTRELLHDPILKARFEQEAQTIAALEHPAIVPVYDFGEDEKRPYLVMRLMNGGTLGDRLNDSPLSVADTAAILNRIGSALERAHEQGIIHRDLKPSNIMFDQYDDAFLADFGIARLTEGALTLTGENVIGTPSYMSPEQIHGEQTIDGRSDIYALGVICFEMLTGRRPYQEKTPAKVMMQHLIDPVPDILEVNPNLPPGMEEIISRSMAKSPEERYANAGEFVDTLDSLAQIDRLTPPPTPMQAAAVAAAASMPVQADELSPVTPETAGDMEVTIPDSGEMMAPAPSPEPAPLPASVAQSTPDDAVGRKDGRNKRIVPGALELPVDSSSVAIPVQAKPVPDHEPEPPLSERLSKVIRRYPVRIGAIVLFVILALWVIFTQFAARSELGTATETPSSETKPPAVPITAALGDTWTRPADGMRMVFVPGGNFLMGSSDNETEEGSAEWPAHPVVVGSFWIDQTEVTTAMHKKCVENGICTELFNEKINGGDRPVEKITWDGANQYCDWAEGHLPDEAQWEYAARGQESSKYPWGDGLPNETLLNYESNFDGTSVVGSYPAGESWVGALDMAGNVWEWTSSSFQAYQDNIESDTDFNEELRVARGGSWLNDENLVRSSYRQAFATDEHYTGVGFRCVIDSS